jgi:hypothetical protein
MLPAAAADTPFLSNTLLSTVQTMLCNVTSQEKEKREKERKAGRTEDMSHE